jgi:hypothetical protein
MKQQLNTKQKQKNKILFKNLPLRRQVLFPLRSYSQVFEMVRK